MIYYIIYTGACWRNMSQARTRAKLGSKEWSDHVEWVRREVNQAPTASYTPLRLGSGIRDGSMSSVVVLCKQHCY